MGFRVTLVQPTPNPNAVKFVLDRVIAEQPTSFLQADAAKYCPLAEQLFLIAGVRSILFLGGFVTINKHPDVPWPPIKRQVKQLLSKVTELKINNNP
jgi:scaffold Nfu/NifU family protein